MLGIWRRDAEHGEHKRREATRLAKLHFQIPAAGYRVDIVVKKINVQPFSLGGAPIRHSQAQIGLPAGNSFIDTFRLGLHVQKQGAMKTSCGTYPRDEVLAVPTLVIEFHHRSGRASLADIGNELFRAEARSGAELTLGAGFPDRHHRIG
ncbi:MULTISPECIES: hypothetical protein [Bradyrhizobium]|uniref:Uncharacterized protein n=1 Tax=Bradyrhizobium septentrionale TaxID=1404411 RepID=A0A974A3E9_9BRAD|nr:MULTISPECIES: hypothetical protein [Bradyrhizobium]MCK7672946.1 hypothetical protein [Bradyrhizobium sp. 2S1]QIG94544.1 hypothetical protein G6P99_20345 [Bradyrhizobium sp. 6(2017)]UGY17054.1 hypothetical protein HAP48_0006330 [Bradyrhizobium septentrionale]UGY25798.1 hypothetical protein HU675_0003060 [Bradyrhizobium septentrionale]